MFPIQFVKPDCTGDYSVIGNGYAHFINIVGNSAVIAAVSLVAIGILKCFCGTCAVNSFVLPTLTVLATATGIVGIVGAVAFVYFFYNFRLYF
jgi:hypothetical protein